MSRRTYNTGSCYLCGHPVSNCGLAVSSHNRMHVRQGHMVETPGIWTGKRRLPPTYQLTPKGGELYNRYRDERPCGCTNGLTGKPCKGIGIAELTMNDGSKRLACHRHQWHPDSTDRVELKPLK